MQHPNKFRFPPLNVNAHRLHLPQTSLIIVYCLNDIANYALFYEIRGTRVGDSVLVVHSVHVQIRVCAAAAQLIAR